MKPPRSWIPFLVLTLSLLLTVGGTWYSSYVAREEDQLRFENLVQKNQAILQNRMETYVALLRGARGLFTSSDEVSRDEFRTFVAGLDLPRRYPGIQGIGFSLTLDAGWKKATEAAVRRSGEARFRIWPESPRDEVHTILYLEPMDLRNRAALGYNMSTEPARRAAMERARDTGQPAATRRVKLVQEIEPQKQPGFLIYIPVYKRGEPTGTVEERRAALAGFVFSPFRAHDLLQGILGGVGTSLALEVYSGEPALDNLLFRSHSPRVVGPDPQLTARESFAVADTSWTVLYSTLPAFEAGSDRDQAPILLLAGLLSSALLFGLTRAQVDARWRAERIAADLRRSERELREEAGVSEALRAIGMAVAGELDFEKLLQTITDEAARVTGARFGAFFHHVAGAEGPSYRLSTVSGAPREVFDGFVMPALLGEGPLRVHDGLADRRHGRIELPGRVAVRSCLAAPVVSRSGEILGALFFGHPEPGVFSARAERVLAGIAAQAAVAMDNARLYEAERRSRAEAETANHAKDRFVATLSHELRTPLTPVLAILARLESLAGPTPLPPVVRDGLATLRRNVELEARIIDDLLDVTRISQGKLELRCAPTDLRQVLAQALEASAVPGASGPRVVVELAEGDLRLQADAPRLTQVFWNLLSNARKFTPPDGTIRVRAGCEDGEVVAEVSDTGIGIGPELMPRIFDAFEQGQRAITRQFGGLGLGLAITQKIVELHGGRITAFSEGPGRGATFTVRLPVGDPAPAGPPVPAGETGALGPPAPPGNTAAPAPAPERPLRILLVEDHPDTAEAMADLLRVTGRRVTVGRTVAEGLRLAAADPHGIDLVLSDIGLPDGSGLELMAELSRRYGLRGIALTGYGMEEDVTRSRAAGFARHLTKPVSLEQLEAAIREVAGAQPIYSTHS